MKKASKEKQLLRYNTCMDCPLMNPNFKLGFKIRNLWAGIVLKGYPQCGDCGCFLKTTPLGKLGKTTIDAEQCPNNNW